MFEHVALIIWVLVFRVAGFAPAALRRRVRAAGCDERRGLHEHHEPVEDRGRVQQLPDGAAGRLDQRQHSAESVLASPLIRRRVIVVCPADVTKATTFVQS